MAARSTVILQDREATPVSHSFSPDGDDANGVHVFSEKTGVPIGNSRLTASLRNSNGKYRPSLRLQVPIVQTQTINGVSSPVVVRTAYADLTFTFDASSTEQERENVTGMLADALLADQTMINDLIVNLSDIY